MLQQFRGTANCIVVVFMCGFAVEPWYSGYNDSNHNESEFISIVIVVNNHGKSKVRLQNLWLNI